MTTILILALLAATRPQGDPAGAPPKKPATEPQAAPKHRDGEILIIGEAQNLDRIPGSGALIPMEAIQEARPRDINELIRRVAGVHARDEEGMGLRPNLGVRGLNPTRSAKLLLLEDGIPFVIGPYGDNTTYYHPPVERFERIEVLKGAGQILYGPNTVGGVFNYVTRPVPRSTEGELTVAAGAPGYWKVHGVVGGGNEKGGIQLDYLHKEADGRADNIHSSIDDLLLRAAVSLGERTTATLKFNYLHEDSLVTYAGLTQSEYEDDPYQNPFNNDQMLLTRLAVHGILQHRFSDDVEALVNLYANQVERDWWRQWHNGVNNNVIPAAQATTTPDSQASGRLREYFVYGLEPRLKARYTLLIPHETDFGVRAHYESQDRMQLNGPNAPEGEKARTGTVAEDNEREVAAYSGFLQNRFLVSDALSVTAGVRLERMRFVRTNQLAEGGLGETGSDTVTQWIPGFGLNWLPHPALTLFGGVHLGFAPPRVEDAIDNNGVPVELDPEKSWNYELGMRWRPASWASLETTLFHMDFENQIVPSSVAGGTGSVATNGGETLHQGAELMGTLDLLRMLETGHRLELGASWTWLWKAEFEGTRYSSVTGAALMPGEAAVEEVGGNRLPYAPEHLLTLSLGYGHPSGFFARIEAVYVDEQYSDDRETEDPVPSGRRGLLEDYWVWNFTASQEVAAWNTTFFLTVKNLADEEYIVDRTRGIYAGMPRSIAAGFTVRF
jgi:Fe(3+) dicitrate transport protein